MLVSLFFAGLLSFLYRIYLYDPFKEVYQPWSGLVLRIVWFVRVLVCTYLLLFLCVLFFISFLYVILLRHALYF
jgi:hypothetical protein